MLSGTFSFVKFHSSLFPNGCLNSWYLRQMTDTNTAEKLLLINCSALADIAISRRASRLSVMDIFWKGNSRSCYSHFVVSVERIPEGPFTRKKCLSYDLQTAELRSVKQRGRAHTGLSIMLEGKPFCYSLGTGLLLTSEHQNEPEICIFFDSIKTVCY